MIDLHCYVRFSTSLDLHQVTETISAHLFGGLPFRETEEFDEMPGYRLDVMMLSIRVYGGGPIYGLVIDPDSRMVSPADQTETVDISPFIERALTPITQIQIIST